MRRIRFWLDASDPLRKKIMVMDEESGKCKELTKPKDIGRFLDVHQLQWEDLKGVREGEDRLGLFKEVLFRWRKRKGKDVTR